MIEKLENLINLQIERLENKVKNQNTDTNQLIAETDVLRTISNILCEQTYRNNKENRLWYR